MGLSLGDDEFMPGQKMMLRTMPRDSEHSHHSRHSMVIWICRMGYGPLSDLLKIPTLM
jgi:hypothetical protein